MFSFLAGGVEEGPNRSKYTRKENALIMHILIMSLFLMRVQVKTEFIHPSVGPHFLTQAVHAGRSVIGGYFYWVL